MFTWICPQCGREVPPSYTECPDCAARGAQETAAAPAETQAPAPPVVIPPPAAASGPPTEAAPTRGPVVPVWLLAIILVLAFVGLGACIYGGVRYFGGKGSAAESAAAPQRPGVQGKPHPYQRYVEVTGIRFTEDAKNKKTIARFVLVNHSSAEIAGLEGTVTIFGRTRKSSEENEGTFSFKAPTLAPFEVKDLSAPVETRLRIYELPDWQNIDAQLRVTAPAP